MNIKQLVKDYLVFSKKERIGIYCILIFVLFLSFYPSLFTKEPTSNLIIVDSVLIKLIDTVQQENKNRYVNEESAYTNEPSRESKFVKGQLFTFDPNTLPAEGWSRLGLKERTIKTIINYRGKGGRFYKPDDLQKIWGLPNGFYEHVAQHIQISSIQTNSEYNYPNKPNLPFEKKERTFSTININQTDTTSLIALPGIGTKLATRIINFRDKLGGFHSVDQIKETYGLPDSTFQKLKPYFKISSSEIKTLNINKATKEELKSHPYIKWQLANVIIEYRNQHGGFKNLNDLKNIHLIDENAYNRILPYLSL